MKDKERREKGGGEAGGMSSGNSSLTSQHGLEGREGISFVRMGGGATPRIKIVGKGGLVSHAGPIETVTIPLGRL